MTVTFDTVRDMALALGDAEVSTSYGTPALKVRGALYGRLREDPDSLVVRVEMDQRDPDALRGLLRGAWSLAARTKQRSGPTRAAVRRRH